MAFGVDSFHGGIVAVFGTAFAAAGFGLAGEGGVRGSRAIFFFQGVLNRPAPTVLGEGHPPKLNLPLTRFFDGLSRRFARLIATAAAGRQLAAGRGWGVVFCETRNG